MHHAAALATPRFVGVRAALVRLVDHLVDRLFATRRQALRFALRLERSRQRRLTEYALGRLDGYMLRDLGIGASEIGSMARECAGEIEATRIRARTDASAA